MLSTTNTFSTALMPHSSPAGYLHNPLSNTQALLQDSAPKARILIAEDTPSQRLLLERLLKSQRFEVITTNDGQEALDYLQNPDKVLPDLLILDIVMPRMSGIEVCEHVKNSEEFKHMPVIIMSSRHDDTLAAELAASGANIFLPKPLKLGHLLTNIHQVVAVGQA